MAEAEPTATPTTAGVYDYALGGTHNTTVDRALLDRVRQVMPEIFEVAWANRGFLQRAVARMAGQWRIRQFLDIGAGFPTRRNTHDVVAESTPDGRVVYVDNDPHVVEEGREILAASPGTAMVLGDLRRPDEILAHPETRRLLDLTEPVGLLVVGVVHVLSDDEDPWGLVARCVDALAPGSYLALSAMTSDHYARQVTEAVGDMMARLGGRLRTRVEIERFFAGLEVVPPYDGADPMLTHIGLWGAEDPEAADDDSARLLYAAVAHKP